MYRRFVTWTEPTIYHISCWVIYPHEGVKFPILTNRHWVTSWWSIGSFGYTSWLDKQLGNFRKMRCLIILFIGEQPERQCRPVPTGKNCPDRSQSFSKYRPCHVATIPYAKDLCGAFWEIAVQKRFREDVISHCISFLQDWIYYCGFSKYCDLFDLLHCSPMLANVLLVCPN